MVPATIDQDATVGRIRCPEPSCQILQPQSPGPIPLSRNPLSGNGSSPNPPRQRDRPEAYSAAAGVADDEVGAAKGSRR